MKYAFSPTPNTSALHERGSSSTSFRCTTGRCCTRGRGRFAGGDLGCATGTCSVSAAGPTGCTTKGKQRSQHRSWKAEERRGWSLFQPCPSAREEKNPIRRRAAVLERSLVPGGCEDGEVAWAGRGTSAPSHQGAVEFP